MILDEPTSNLDHKNELEIFQTLNKINEATSITMIVITHKKALLKFCSNTFLLLNCASCVLNKKCYLSMLG